MADEFRTTFFFGPEEVPGRPGILMCVFNTKKRSWKGGIQIAVELAGAQLERLRERGLLGELLEMLRARVAPETFAEYEQRARDLFTQQVCRAKLDLAIEETLRWEAPVQYVSRETTADATVAGIDIPAGELVSAALGSANRDERHFEDPDRFDLHRRLDDHLAFGLGPHFCAGSHLARAEARIALGALLDRLPNLRLDAAQRPQVVGLALRSPDRLPVLFDP